MDMSGKLPENMEHFLEDSDKMLDEVHAVQVSLPDPVDVAPDYEAILQEFLLPFVPDATFRIRDVKLVFKDFLQVEITGGYRPSRHDVNRWHVAELLKVLAYMSSPEFLKQAKEAKSSRFHSGQHRFSNTLVGQLHEFGGRICYQIDRMQENKSVERIRFALVNIKDMRQLDLGTLLQKFCQKQPEGKLALPEVFFDEVYMELAVTLKAVRLASSSRMPPDDSGLIKCKW